MSIIYKKPNLSTIPRSRFAPDAPHGLILKLVTSVIDELEIGGDTIAVGLSDAAVICRGL